MRELIDYKSQVSEIRDRSAAVISACGQTEDSADLKRDTDDILRKTSPSIMFYGLYNAGKSSIINAVFGKEIAAVGDIPTTNKVQTIEWNNFTIVDTPGINAKNEHTLIADSAISKSDVVLFVVDDMNVEEKTFYSAFISVLKKNIPVIIAINQKNADYSLISSDTISKLKSRIVENITYAAKQQNVPDVEHRKNFYGIIPVNAMSAFESKAAGGRAAELLYDESNLEELIVGMQSLLNSSDGVRMLIPALNIMEDKLNAVSEMIKSHIKSDFEKNYYVTADKIKRQKDSLYNRLINEGRAQIMSFGDEMAAAVTSGGTNALDSGVICDRLGEVIKRCFGEANLSLQSQYELYRVNMGDMQLNINKSDFMLTIPDSEDTEKSFDAFDFLKDLPILTTVPTEKLPLPIVVPDGDPTPGIIITVIKGLIDLFSSKKKAEEERRQLIEQINESNRQAEARVNEMITRIMDINSKIRSEMFKLEESYTNSVTELVNKAYEPVLASIKANFDENRQSSDEAEKQLTEISELLQNIAKIRSAINL